MKPGSKSWKKFMAKLYGLGAAVVILGALFKIMHWQEPVPCSWSVSVPRL